MLALSEPYSTFTRIFILCKIESQLISINIFYPDFNYKNQMELQNYPLAHIQALALGKL